ncbi:methionyl-tRNA formyltransferase [Glaciecola sp. SC05]|uniref:methionyl-tRNA formyltransferase n=1 Tax=Glaciecola sp. SC05 TaxID=1987355 RepID=UPI003527CEFA
MKIIFAGTPEFAAAHLQALIHAGHNIIAVYTQPDRPSGRGNKLTPSAVKLLALKHDIPVEQPPSLKSDDALRQLQNYHADLMVVVAYGLLLPKAVLDTPQLGCINVHGSLLPKWRGAAPIQRAIWAGDKSTGVTIMQMDEGLDTGPMLLMKSTDILHTETSADLYERLATLGPATLLECLSKIKTLRPVKQDDAAATYAKKLSKEEAKCDWSLSCHQLARNVRAFNPWPMAWFESEHKNIKIHQAMAIEQAHNIVAGTIVRYDKEGLDVACTDGILRITSLQMPGKKAQAINQLVNGNPNQFVSGSEL